MKKLFFLFFSFVFFMSTHQAIGQDPYTRLKQTAAQSPVITKQMASIVISESDSRLKVERKTPIPFKPFDMVDLKGRKIDPNETTVINGKKITAREFFDKLNEIERDQNGKGYSIRNEKTALQVNLVTPASSLDGRVPELSRSIGRVKSEAELKSLSPTSKMIGNFRLNPYGNYNDAERKKMAESKFSVDAQGNLNISPNNNSLESTLKTTHFSKKFGNTHAPIKDLKDLTATTGNSTTSGALKVISDITVKDWSLGDASTFKAGVQATLLRSAKIYHYNPQSPGSSKSEFKIDAKAKLYGEIHNNSFDMLLGEVELFAPADSSKPMSVKEQIQLAGITVLNATQNFTQSKTLAKSNARNFDYSYPYYVPICCGVGFTGKIGIKGSVGLNYHCSVFRTVVNLDASPVMEIKGYAEGGASVGGIATVGAGIDLTFLKGSIPLNSYVGLWAQNADQIVIGYNYYMGYELNMLSGRFYVYADVCCPWVGCHRLGSVNLFNWNGFNSSGTIVDGGKNEVIANL
ncbi:MAG: hypothetical protein JSU03_08260 [Bacteroidetes bacterium]|nr:hypothetical protein [Bacteroidota bacterium]MBS1757256.1 hypothetical protein [Bacteroidota bacterium]